MTYKDFGYEWDDELHNGMGGWRITEHQDKPFRDANDFLTALNKRLS